MLFRPRVSSREELIYCVANSLDPKVVGEVTEGILDPRSYYQDNLDLLCNIGRASLGAALKDPDSSEFCKRLALWRVQSALGMASAISLKFLYSVHPKIGVGLVMDQNLLDPRRPISVFTGEILDLSDSLWPVETPRDMYSELWPQSAYLFALEAEL